MPSKGSQPEKTQVTLHILTQEGECCDLIGGPNPAPMVQPLWDAHAGGATGESQEDGQM